MSNNQDLFAYTEQGSWARLILNQPERFNPLSRAMIDALTDKLREISHRSELQVVIIGARGKAFCPGHDLKEMHGFKERRESDTNTQHQALFDACSQMMLLIQQMPQVVIAQVQGIATAAGCQLVGMCDLAIAAKSARFAVSGINYGLFCATPATALSRNVSRKRAMYMLMTGEFIDANTAVDWGLINEAVDDVELNERVTELAEHICRRPQSATAFGKRLFYRQIEAPLDEALTLAAQTMACNAIDPAAVEGVDAFVGKRAPNWHS